MAPAVHQHQPADALFHRSHSTPDLLSGRPTTNRPSSSTTSSVSISSSSSGSPFPHDLSPSRQRQRTLSLKSLPSLPAFDVPSLDFDFSLNDDGLKTALRFDTTAVTTDSTPTPPDEKKSAAPTTTLTQVAIPAKQPPGKKGRKPMIDRRRWLPSSRSTPDVRISSEDEVPATPKLPNATPIIETKKQKKEAATPEPKPKPLERSRTMESLAGLARRSWMSTGSRSPSPSPKKGSKDSSSRQRASNAKKDKVRVLIETTGTGTRGSAAEHAESATAPPRSSSPIDSSGSGLELRVGDATTEPRVLLLPRESPSSKSAGRALNKASSYLTKLSKRPQSFVRATSSQLSRSASSTIIISKGNEGNNNNSTTTTPASITVSSTLSPLAAEGNANTLTIGNNNTLCNLSHRNSSQTTSSTTTETTGCVSISDQASSQATAETNLTMPHPTSRDPLWATFRKLDADYAAFAAKTSTAAKMAAVRATLVPFLRNTASHPSNRNRAVLAPEDVDRRSTILNKWWNGLLEMLDTGSTSVMAGMRVHSNLAFNTTNHMNNLQPVAGVDRPTLLEATTMIMVRPEWRLSTTYFQPLAERSPAEIVRPRSDTQSSTTAETQEDDDDQSAWVLSGGGAETMIVQSAEHNVRTMFVTNLTTQMALVVDKMSMRHAPTSLVNWSGKACAYAFFFAPGIADILVRLWGLRAELVRRVADEFKLPRRSKGESEDIVALFPPNLGGLGWTSVKTITDKLRSAARLPLLASTIQWHGPWVSRWRGADTDLLFIFTKYYYMLAEEFIPADLPLVEKARSPAFVLLHAQLLVNLDSSIQRQGPADALTGPPLTDGIYGADAFITSALSVPPYNLMKGMAENRMVVLLKDMLIDSTTTAGVLPGVKLSFAEAFMALAKAATKKTPRYEHTAVFMLCDFLEEVLGTYNYWQHTVNNAYATSPAEEAFPPFDPSVTPTQQTQVDLIDWPFWFGVCKLSLESNNTMAEIRVLSFIYTLWDAIVESSPSRKRALVVDWLLSEQTFDRFFNNWCPMVRAYYMRLLCWRICRDSGSPNNNSKDEEIFLLASRRLNTAWAHYLWMKKNAEDGRSLPTSTAPCYPTPGKRFMIIRTEVMTPQPGLYVGFDQSGSSSAGATEGVPYTLPTTPAANSTSTPSSETSSKKKSWSLIGKVLSMTAGAATGINMAGGNMKRTWDNDNELDTVRRETAASRSGSTGRSGPPPPPKQTATGVPSSSDSTSSTGSAPVYDEIQYQFRFTLTWQNHAAAAAGPPRDRVLTRPRLPALAQSRVSSRLAALADPTRTVTPPAAAGLPPATRRVSGADATGLVTAARNSPQTEAASATPKPRRPSLPNRSRTVSIDSAKSVEYSSPDAFSFSEAPNLDLTSLAIRPLRTSLSADDNPAATTSNATAAIPTTTTRGSTSTEPFPTMETSLSTTTTTTALESPPDTPLRPTGIYISNATYSGRALAEWSIVVAECNNFIDRRRDEGVLGLQDVEVPSLGVDGLGMRAFGGRA
ncbi:hypothetical protein GE09DRAFT_1147935, partial [Coniochaeta sp. 2T2.1]